MLLKESTEKRNKERRERKNIRSMNPDQAYSKPTCNHPHMAGVPPSSFGARAGEGCQFP